MSGKPEEIEQKKVVQYLQVLEKRGKIITFFAPMNENIMSGQNRAMSIRIEAKAKAMGKRAGVSDLVIVLCDRVLFVEMKRAGRKLKNGKISISGIQVSPNQEDFLSKIGSSSVCDGYVAYGFDDFVEKIQKYL